MDDPNEKFKVVQFFRDGTYEEVIAGVNAETAVTKARALTDTVGVRMGLVKDIIIIDQGDRTVFEWKAGEGVTFPTIRDRNLN